MAIPTQYEWLTREGGPVMITTALNLFDTLEAPGLPNNPVILNWAAEIGGEVENMYKSDEIPWCGLFMAVVAKRSRKELVKDPLWALNWGNFGKNTDVPMLGDVLVFVRKTTDGHTAGHVGLYVGEDEQCFHVLGGNQMDRVCITRLERKRLYTGRRPNYATQPANVRKIILRAGGAISANES